MRRVICLVAVAGCLCAQTPTAILVGTVRDSSGAAVAGALVNCREVNTNQVRTVTVSATGEFTLPNLAPGQYEIAVEKEGFRTARRTGVELQVDQTARMDFELQVGTLSETVDVLAEAPLLNTENAVKGEVISSREIVEMPLDGRDFADLAHLVPGVLPRAQGGQGSAFAINGARADNTNFIIDGFNDQNPRGGAAQARPNLDAMQEFKMQVSGYSAEYGRLAGGVMNMVLKTGTNQLHGAIFEFLRNDALDARNFFDVDKHKLRRNQFGATLGGPVWIPRLYNGRDRTFFLFSWESYRQVLGENRLGIVPTAPERAGDFSPVRDGNGKPLALKDPFASGPFPGNLIPASRVHPVSARLLPYYPLPNRPEQSNNYLASAIDPDNWDSFLWKLDHRLTARDSLSGRYLKRYNRNSNPFNGSDLGTFGNIVGNHQMLAGLTHIRMFSPVLINEVRFGVSRTADREREVHAGEDFATELGISGTTTEPKLIGFPRFTIRDLMSIGAGANMPVEFTVNNYQWGDTLTWAKARHLMKFGGEVLRTQFSQPYYNNNRGTFNFLGRWTGDPFADFLLGLPESTSRQVGSTTNYLFSTGYGFFAQDDYKLTGRLTLNLGLRYEILKPPVEKYGRLSNFLPELRKTVLADDRTVPDLAALNAQYHLTDRVALARDLGLPASLVYTRYRNFAPRFGFAWRPLRGNRMVLRGGYGIFYSGSVLNQVRLDLADVYPFALSQTFNRQGNNPAALTLSDPFPLARAAAPAINTSGYELRAPSAYLQSWNLTLERDLGAGSALEIAYSGSKGTHLGRRYDLNQPFFNPDLRLPNGSFPRPYSGVNAINYYSFGSNSIYDAATITFRRRFSGGFFYRVNYTFSKSIDDASQLTGNADGGYPGAQDARNLRGERARSDWDAGHSLTLDFSYQPPWQRSALLRRWQFAGTGRAHTGQPFTPRVSNVNLNLGEANRPDRIAKGAVPHPTPDLWFDRDSFPAVPTGAFRFGNSGRNVLDGPGFMAINFSLLRNFALGEKGALQARWEVFNVVNHPNFHLPTVFVNAPNAATIREADPGRLMQFGLHYRF